MTTYSFGRLLTDFKPLHPAEQTLMHACRDGRPAIIGSNCPKSATPDNTVRAAFIRFMALSGDDKTPVHERGLRLRGAWVEGKLDLVGCQLPHPLGLLDCAIAEPVDAKDMRVQGSLNLSGSSVVGLNFERANIAGSVFLRNGFSAKGQVRLLGAQIGSNLECDNSSFDGNGGDALNFERANIAGSVFLRNGFSAKGKVLLIGAQIGSSFACSSSSFDGNGGDALNFERANIAGSVFLRNGFSAKGKVRLIGVQISGDLECGNSSFDGKNNDALNFDRAKIAGSVFLGKGFSAKGTVSLIGAQINGDLFCKEANFVPLKSAAISCANMCVKGRFFFQNLVPATQINLNHAQIGVLLDDVASWGAGSILNGFTYTSLGGGAPTDAITRLTWLDTQSEEYSGKAGPTDRFRPQPWKQLQKVLRDMGHADSATEIGIAYEKRLRHVGRRGTQLSLARLLHAISGGLMAYGYRPLRLVMWMVIVWLIGAAIYWWAALDGIMAPSNPLVFQKYEKCRNNWYLCETLPDEYTGFSPLTYSLDVILPVIDLQQEHDWAPRIPTPLSQWYKELGSLTAMHGVRLYLWFEILFGWISTLLLVAVVTGLTKRGED